MNFYLKEMGFILCFSSYIEDKEKKIVKRFLEEKLQFLEFVGLFKNKVKKLLRNFMKKLGRNSEENYEKCVNCFNIRVCVRE